MPKELRVGIVGAVSAYSLHYGRALSQMPGVVLAGLAHLGRSPRYIEHAWNLPWLERYPKTLEGFSEAFGVPLYEQAEEMIEVAGLDAVCITTEDYLHLHHALRAIEQGVHVFVPKPFASSPRDAERMFSAGRARNVVVIGSLPNRFRSPYVTARQAIDEGAIGRPIAGHFSIEHHLTLGGWKSDPSMAAGPEYEMGFYVFDTLRWMIGSEPQSVMGFGANLDHHGIPWIDNGKCIIRCANGALASVDLCFSMHHRFAGNSMQVIGNEGALALEPDPKSKQQVVAIYTRAGVERLPIPSWDATQRELGDWIALCQNGKNPAPWQEEAMRTLDLIVAYKRSHESGQVVALPTSEERE